MNVERISAITIKVSDMTKSVHFYNKLLGLKILYGGQKAYFSSLQTLSAKDTILNLEQGHLTRDWGRIIFYVGDVDKSWAYLKEKEYNPDRPRDAEWGETVLPSARPRRPPALICAASRLRLLGSFIRKCTPHTPHPKIPFQSDFQPLPPPKSGPCFPIEIRSPDRLNSRPTIIQFGPSSGRAILKRGAYDLGTIPPNRECVLHSRKR